MKDYKSNRNIVHLCRYHVVFTVKYRRKFLFGDIENDLKDIVSQVCKERKAEYLPEHI